MDRSSLVQGAIKPGAAVDPFSPPFCLLVILTQWLRRWGSWRGCCWPARWRSTSAGYQSRRRSFRRCAKHVFWLGAASGAGQITYMQPFSFVQYRAALQVPLEQALRVRDALISQMEIGLAEHHSKRGLLMLPSYIDILPTGQVGAFTVVWTQQCCRQCWSIL